MQEYEQCEAFRLLMELRDTGSPHWNPPEDALRFDDLSEPEVKE